MEEDRDREKENYEILERLNKILKNSYENDNKKDDRNGQDHEER